MVVAGEDQVEVVRLGPAKLVGRVGEQDAKRQAVWRRAAAGSAGLGAGPNQGSSLPARTTRMSPIVALRASAADVDQSQAASSASSRRWSTRRSWLPSTK